MRLLLLLSLLCVFQPYDCLPSERTETILDRTSAVIGQSIACGLPQKRVVALMMSQVEALKSIFPDNKQMLQDRDDIIRQSARAERDRAVPRCDEIERDLFEIEGEFLEKEIPISDAAAGLHLPASAVGQAMKVRMPVDEHFVHVVEDALKLLGHEGSVLVLERPYLKNGFAFKFITPIGNDISAILYDPNEFADSQEKLQGDDSARAGILAAMFTMGHEIGHHVCKHLENDLGSRPWKEVEADRIAGRILATSKVTDFLGGGTFDDYQWVMRKMLPADASSSHPALKDRLTAFSEGWHDSRGCK